MLIKLFVRKNVLNSEIFLGKPFQKKTNACLFAEAAVLVNQQHPQLNGTKIVALEIVYARVHLLNECGLYKMIKQKKMNKVHIG